ncbi:MAG: ABC transporter permease [Solirubrobacteraceae bacterium]
MTTAVSAAADTGGELRTAATGPVRAQRPPRPWPLIGASAGVAIVLVLPLTFLLIESASSGSSTIVHLIFRSLTVSLLWNTVRLTLAVTALCAVIGTTAAWLVERTDLPCRRIWAVLVVVPLAVPDFVVSFGWSSISTWVEGFRGAVLVMTLAIYPLVYLPVAASFRHCDPGQEEVARSLGLGRAATFWRVTLRQARGAIIGGCLLVTLVLLAEYGAFEILGYQTFTTEIFTEFNVSLNVQAASALSLVLVTLSALVLCGESAVQRGRRISRSGPLAQRVGARHQLGRARLPALVFLLVLIGLALGVPIGSSIYWILQAAHPYLQGVSLLAASWNTALYGVSAAGLSTLMALPVAVLSVRHRGGAYRLLERSTFLVLAMPGLVIALALSYFTERFAGGLLYQSSALLVLSYAILFFPLALVAVRASVLQAPPELEDIGRSLGRRRLSVLCRVTLPLVGPGLAAAFCLVFLSAVTELTATLILIPIGVQTLATQFWAYQQNLAYGQAAPFALASIAIAVVPSIVLGLFFDRRPWLRRTA